MGDGANRKRGATSFGFLPVRGNVVVVDDDDLDDDVAWDSSVVEKRRIAAR